MKIKIITLFFLFALVSFRSIAATITWTGCKSNDWHLAANWNIFIVPKYTDIVIIPTPAAGKPYPVITGIACCSLLNITSPATDALTINTTGGGVLHVGNSAPVPLERRIVFVSTTDRASTYSVANRNTDCNNNASAAGLCGTYRAWISTGASNNVAATTNIEYVLPNGTKVADNWGDLTDGTLDAAIDKYANGTSAAGWDVWTGLLQNGTVGGNTCSNWGNQTSNGIYGAVSSTTSGDWTDAGNEICQDYTTSTTSYYDQGNAQANTCATCDPGTSQTFCSQGCGGVRWQNNTCITNPCDFTNGCCRKSTPGGPKEKRHYCFQQ